MKTKTILLLACVALDFPACNDGQTAAQPDAVIGDVSRDDDVSFDTEGDVLDPCATMDAQLAGEVRDCGSVGFLWNGTECFEAVGYCECIGADCDAMYDTLDSCRNAYSQCISEQCEPLDATFYGYEYPCDRFWGYMFDGERCYEVEGWCECIGNDCGALYDSLADCRVAHSQCLTGPCVPLDASFDINECDRFWGYMFNGVECYEVVGFCECAGEDCDALYDSLEICREAHPECVAGGTP